VVALFHSLGIIAIFNYTVITIINVDDMESWPVASPINILHEDAGRMSRRNIFAMNMHQLNTVISFIVCSLHEVYKVNVFWGDIFQIEKKRLRIFLWNLLQGTDKTKWVG
jgi:hypothetical protein